MLVERKKYLNFLLKQKDKDVIKIITGLRRSGKSTLLFQLFYKKLLDMKVKEDHIIRIALDNIRNAELTNPLKLYNEISMKIVDQEKYYVLLDEKSLEKV